MFNRKIGIGCQVFIVRRWNGALMAETSSHIILYIRRFLITEYIAPPGDAHSHEAVDAAEWPCSAQLAIINRQLYNKKFCPLIGAAKTRSILMAGG